MQNTMIRNSLLLFLGGAIAVGGFLFYYTASANPFYVGSKAKSAAATTTVAYLTASVSTSTVVYDSYEINGTNQSNTGNLTIPDTLAVAIQGIASSTSSVIKVVCEYSDDSVDWYDNEMFATTTSTVVNITSPGYYTFTYATSTLGGVTSTTNKFSKVFTCPVPLRYVRTVTTATGAGASVYMSLIPKKQRN